MHTGIAPLTKLLLPVDGDQNIKRPAILAGRIAALLAGRIELITLLHVMAGRYLSQHMVNIDFRAEQILESDQFRRIRQQYIDEEITPVLNEMEGEILAQESNVPVERGPWTTLSWKKICGCSRWLQPFHCSCRRGCNSCRRMHYRAGRDCCYASGKAKPTCNPAF